MAGFGEETRKPDHGLRERRDIAFRSAAKRLEAAARHATRRTCGRGAGVIGSRRSRRPASPRPPRRRGRPPSRAELRASSRTPPASPARHHLLHQETVDRRRAHRAPAAAPPSRRARAHRVRVREMQRDTAHSVLWLAAARRSSLPPEADCVALARLVRRSPSARAAA